MGFSLKKPSNAEIAALRKTKAEEGFSYPEELRGLTRQGGDAVRERLGGAWVVDENACVLGQGQARWDAACAAVRSWVMFGLGWVELHTQDAPIEVGAVVGVLARGLGLWSLNFARVVYVIDEREGPVWRFGFAYGTLHEHVERGEERFMVSWDRDRDEVGYELLAFSQRNHWLARLGAPYTRHLQRRFARDSMRNMTWIVEAWAERRKG